MFNFGFHILNHISSTVCFLRKDRIELCGFANYRKALGKQRTKKGKSVHFLSRKSMLLVPKSAKAMPAFRVVFYSYCFLVTL